MDKVQPFRFWCQKVLPAVYDESLSYYEVLCKVVNYINNIIDGLKMAGANIENLEKEFAELKKYVTNYFDSTDFQAMVNQKLDTMANDGTLSELIAKLGTLGIINVKSFGAVGDGVTDDTTALKTAFASAEGRVVVIPNGTYLVSSSFDYPKGGWGSVFNIGVVIPSNCHILGCGSTIKMKPNANACGYNMQGRESNNVIIENLNFIGDSDKHTYSEAGGTHEWGIGLALYGCQNVEVRNCTFKNFTGDGIYIGQDFRNSDNSSTTYNSGNVKVSGCVVDTVRRNGISVCDGKGHIIQNCRIKNAKGTSPESCIDVETEGDGNQVPAEVAIIDTVLSSAKQANLLVFKGGKVTVNNSIVGRVDLYYDNISFNGCDIERLLLAHEGVNVTVDNSSLKYINAGAVGSITLNECSWPGYTVEGWGNLTLTLTSCTISNDVQNRLAKNVRAYNCKFISTVSGSDNYLIQSRGDEWLFNCCSLECTNSLFYIDGKIDLYNCYASALVCLNSTANGSINAVGCYLLNNYGSTQYVNGKVTNCTLGWQSPYSGDVCTAETSAKVTGCVVVNATNKFSSNVTSNGNVIA